MSTPQRTSITPSQEYEVVLQKGNRPTETVHFCGRTRADVLYAVAEFYPGHVVKRIGIAGEWG